LTSCRIEKSGEAVAGECAPLLIKLAMAETVTLIIWPSTGKCKAKQIPSLDKPAIDR